MAAPKPADSHQQTLCLIWESELVRDGEGSVRVVARKPLCRMTVKAAAKLLGLSEWTVCKLRKEGILKGAKPGAAKKRRDGRASNAKLMLDAESVLLHHEASKREA